jgi:hypothetical protein
VPITDNPRCLWFTPGLAAPGAVLPARRLLAQAGELAPGALDERGRYHPHARSCQGPRRTGPSSGRVAVIGPRRRRSGIDPETVNPRAIDSLHYDRAVKTPYELECMRRASDSEPAGTGRPGGVSPRRFRIRGAHALSRGLRSARRGDAVQQHRGLQRERGRAALPASGAPQPAIRCARS